jgi:hypothetical protein
MPTRPTDRPSWTQGNPGVQDQPTAPEKFGGWSPNQRPPAQWMNWILGNMSDWIDWFDFKIQAGIAALQGFDWVVGTGGTHADINALIADVNVVPGARILMTSPQTLINTQVISKTDLEFVFKPSAVYSKGLTLVTGIQITVDRVTISGGRFTDWVTSGDKAIQVAVGSKNCLIMGARFANCDTAVDDLGTNTSLVGIIEEV